MSFLSKFASFWIDGVLDIFRSLSPSRWAKVLKDISPITIFWLFIGAAATIVGCAGQTIALNQWLAVWPNIMYENAPVAGPFSIVVFGAMGLAMVFCTLALLSLLQPGALRSVWYVFGGGLPNHGSLKVWAALVGASFCCSTNTVLMTYGASGTPVMLQAVLMSLQVFLTIVFCMIAKVGRGRSYIHLMVLLALAATIGGVVLGLYINIVAVDWTPIARKFTVVYCAGCVPVAIMGVLISIYFRYALYEEETSPSHPNFAALEAARIQKAETAAALAKEQAEGFDHNHGYANLVPKSKSKIEDATAHHNIDGGDMMSDRPAIPPMRHLAIKLVFIALMNLQMIVFCFAYFPLDWNEWMGSNPNNRIGAYQTLTNSWLCLAKNKWPEQCDDARKWFFIFSGVFSSMTLGTVILNRYSPPLCSMLMQIGTPLCSLLLVQYPSLNPPGSYPSPTDKSQVQGAVALVVIGAVILGLWEMISRVRKQEREAEQQGSSGIQGDDRFA